MADVKVKTVLKSLMSTIKKSKYPLAPVDEALSNAFEAILQKTFSKNEKPKITITFDYVGLIEEKKSLTQIIIEDNGLGFDTKNFERFETLLDKTKGYNNRGSGRIQYVHRFDRVNVESYYIEEGKSWKRTFSYNATRFIFDKHSAPILDKHSSGSIVTFKPGDTLDKDRFYYDELEIHELVRSIKRKFLLRYYLEAKEGSKKSPTIDVIFKKNDKIIAQEEISPEKMPAPDKEGEVKVHSVKLKDAKSEEIEWEIVPQSEEILNWARFKLPKTDLDNNAVWLCSKGVTVSPINFGGINKHETVNGQHYLTAFYGNVLNNEDNVSDSVDKFNFPDQKQIESQLREGDFLLPQDEFLFFDGIKNEISKAIPGIYKDIFDVKKKQENRVDEIAREHGIPLDIARKANIGLSDSEAKITDRLYKQQAEHLSHEGQKIQKIFKELKSLNPTAEDYQSELKSRSFELLALIPQQNKEELARYIIRRDMVAVVLQKILGQDLQYQKSGNPKEKKKDKEGLVHDLIFKRKSKDNDQLNDLWILNEEFVHFSGCSDLEAKTILDGDGKPLLRKISQEEIDEVGAKPSMRPDIFLFPDEANCVLIELKNPEIEVADHLNQLIKYCILIANYSTKKMQKFHCYLIGENFNPKVNLDGDWHETVNGDWIRNPIRIMSVKEREQIATAHIEIIKLSSIYSRAYRRNKSFADKLGLRELVEHDSKNEKPLKKEAS